LRATRVVLLAGVVALVAAVVVVASQRAPRLLGSNRVTANAFPLRLVAARTACQVTSVPAGTGDVRILTQTRAGIARPAFTATLDGRRVGRAAGGPAGTRWVAVPVAPRTTTGRPEGLVCLTAAGRGLVALGGIPATVDAAAHTPSGRALPGVARLEFETGRAETWWSTLGATEHRFSRGKASWVGTWTLVLVGILFAGALGAAGWALARREPAP
jgi:hypothetical protein